MPDYSLYKLTVAGKRDVPGVAAAYSRASSSMAAKETGSAAEAFPPEIYEVWSQYRDDVQTVMADVSDHLYRVGNALVLCAEDFAERDQDEADQLEEVAGEEDDKRLLDQEPTEVPPPSRPENHDRPEEEREKDREDRTYFDGNTDNPWANKPVM